MKTVALISGGKDSCYNMMQCVAEGHEIVALANLRPENKDELDSYMYQTVGHQAIELYAEAMNLPLYRRTIKGSGVSLGRDYEPQDTDEVEDLYHLLQEIQSEVDIQAVAVGAILSDYQRVRVENVCARLGLTVLTYLWRREQAPLLKEMVTCGIEAILIKVAALGLDPERHLGLTLQQILPHMLKMEKEFGLNVCGEGGEYETFTLDCPLFSKKIIVDEQEVVIHSADAFAPVGYIRFRKLHLEDKQDHRLMADIIDSLPMLTSSKDMEQVQRETEDAGSFVSNCLPLSTKSLCSISCEIEASCRAADSLFSVGGLLAVREENVERSSHLVMKKLKAILEQAGRKMSDVYFVCLYVSNMSDFATINFVYKTYFGTNPPARICVQSCLPENILFQMDCQGWTEDGQQENSRKTMHVQGISHWAPANIGPYSQATEVGNRVFVAGQIALVPGTMQLVTGGASVQCQLALRHVDRLLRAMHPGCSLNDVVLCICYVTHPSIVPVALRQWEKYLSDVQDDSLFPCQRICGFRSLVEYFVVPSLPRGACVEWQVYARSDNTVVGVSEFETASNSSSLRVISRGLVYSEISSVFTSTTGAYLKDASEDTSVTAASAVSACLQCYSQLLLLMDRRWIDVHMMRVFFPAHLFSYNSVFAALTKELDHRSSAGVQFSLVPVVQLTQENLVMVLCH